PILLLLSCPHFCQAALTRPVVEVHGCDGSERNGLVRFLPTSVRLSDTDRRRTGSAGGSSTHSAAPLDWLPRPGALPAVGPSCSRANAPVGPAPGSPTAARPCTGAWARQIALRSRPSRPSDRRTSPRRGR